MPLIEWDDSYKIGIDAIDSQHATLFAIADRLQHALLQKKGEEVIGDTFADLIEYVSSHFDDEERLMLAHNYPGYEAHYAEHNALRETLGRHLISACGDANGEKIAMNVMSFMQTWLVTHLLKSDMRYAEYVSEHNLQ